MPLNIDLGPAPEVPDFTSYDPRLKATYYTGADAENEARAVLANHYGTVRHIAVDTEAAGLGASSFTVRCVTVAYETSDGTHALVLDPRRAGHTDLVRSLVESAELVVMHNAAYDVPPMYWHGLMPYECIHKVWDTLVAARMAYPDRTVAKGLEALASNPKVLDMPGNDVTMKMAFTSAGYSTTVAGWENMDIDSPVYRLGAMADTVVTLRLAPVLTEAVAEWLTSNPFSSPATPDRARAFELLEREHVTNRVMLSASALGLKVDGDYLANYRAEHEATRDEAATALTKAGLDPEAGNVGLKLVELLESKGELPASWPRTATGKLKADKDAMELLAGNPLAEAHAKVAELGKVSGYLTKVDEYARVTGRVHPQVAVLGASATGRMSYSEPELQQFPAAARGILVPDNPGEATGWVSLDWSSIEPVVVANCAGDKDFLAGFNDHGADLYEPITKHAGVTRKVAKVVLLAAMYGQGRALLASNLGVTEAEAADVQTKVFEAMPQTRQFLDALRISGDEKRCTMTADGRLLPVPSDKQGRVMGYKATNYFTQGTAASVLSETINAIHRAGLGKHVRLAIHDELVVDAEAAEAVRTMMETPPAWLNEFAGHKVVLRTDSNPLPDRWAYV